jgi:hypothetical protein
VAEIAPSNRARRSVHDETDRGCGSGVAHE